MQLFSCSAELPFSEAHQKGMVGRGDVGFFGNRTRRCGIRVRISSVLELSLCGALAFLRCVQDVLCPIFLLLCECVPGIEKWKLDDAAILVSVV